MNISFPSKKYSLGNNGKKKKKQQQQVFLHPLGEKYNI